VTRCLPLSVRTIGEFDASLVQYGHLAAFHVKEIARHLENTASTNGTQGVMIRVSPRRSNSITVSNLLQPCRLAAYAAAIRIGPATSR